MSLSNWIRYGQPKQSTIAKSSCSKLATATAATLATDHGDIDVDLGFAMATTATLATNRQYSARTVADVASVSVATAEKRWFRFLDECLLLGVTIDEFQAKFNKQDTDDLLTEPDSKLPLHARTIVDSIFRDRQNAEITRLTDESTRQYDRVYKFRSPPEQTCGSCKYFNRIDHPSIGHCYINAVSEALAGLWDNDGRDYCARWEVSK